MVIQFRGFLVEIVISQALKVINGFKKTSKNKKK